ncbi:MAG: M42 family metallopeptidase, partial [Clostridia bacterium]|nr:M42 family metallopeptidase [Clostridia bacterium]
MKYVTEQLFKLMEIDSPSGFTSRVADYTVKEFRRLGMNAWLTNKGCVVAELGGEGNPLILDAHIDNLGGMVAEIKGNGRLRITNIGGMNANNAETENCKIYCRMSDKVYEGTLQMNDPSVHVNGEYSSQQRKWDAMEIVIDELTASAEETKALGINVGDFVCFEPRTRITESGYIKSRFLDDKLSVAMILDLARQISEGDVKPNRKVYAFITVYEEVGHGACAGFPDDAEEIISVDMGCVGMGLKCTERQVSICAKDSRGPYDYEVTTNLIKKAEEYGIDYAVDIYPFYGSDADAALASGHDLKHGLIGAGVYASHGYERSHIDGVKNTIELMKAY